jgi:hypothetical protein
MTTMHTPRLLTLRIAIAALIWASALLAPAAAAPVNYRVDAPDSGSTTPGPTDPNGPSS